VLEVAVDLTASEMRHRARLVTDYGATPLVDADESRLGQVFVNLLVNAAQAFPTGRSDTNQIRVVTTTDADGRAVVEVHDTGAGIPAPVMPRIFDPFFTTKAEDKGVGLGLAVVYGIVQAHGGDIEVESAPGSGTRFRITLPLAPPTSPDPAADGALLRSSAAPPTERRPEEPAP